MQNQNSITVENSKDLEVTEEVGERDNIAFAKYLQEEHGFIYKDILSFTLPGKRINKTVSSVICVTVDNKVYIAIGRLIDKEWEVTRVPAQKIM